MAVFSTRTHPYTQAHSRLFALFVVFLLILILCKGTLPLNVATKAILGFWHPKKVDRADEKNWGSCIQIFILHFAHSWVINGPEERI
jgi:hypothetical protein